MHSLKGSGGLLGIAVTTTICHQFESFISETSDRFDRKVATTALAYVDLLRKTFEPAGRNTAGVLEIEQALERMRLKRMLHTPFDLLVISRELPDLNAIAVVAAIRESRRRNSNIPVIVVSSNPAPVPKHLRIRGVVRRDPQLRSILAGLVAEALALRRSNQSAAQ